MVAENSWKTSLMGIGEDGKIQYHLPVAKMHIEVQVALNFVISYLYNKLPRRRVNIFGEELERALKDKFRGHWYPEKPFRGSAYRCLKTGDPVDPVLERAARESGVPVQDILENLPHELAVWVDPGEVSYRIGEKGAVKILFNDQHDASEDSSADREVTKTFNPEAQCFRPIEVQVGAPLSAFSLSPSQPASPFAPVDTPGAPSVAVGAVGAVGQPVPQQPVAPSAVVPTPCTASGAPPTANGVQSVAPNVGAPVVGAVVTQAPPPSSGSSPTPTPFKGSPSPVAPYLPRSASTLTFTTATFAQTKFGSTKLKTNTKRANRMSPTEFSNYIKQRALQQQLHHHHHPHHHPGGVQGNTGPQLGPQVSPPSGRSLSPNGLAALASDPGGYFFQTPFAQSFGGPRGLFDGAAPPPAAPVSASGPPPTSYVDPYGGTSKYGNASFLDPHHFYSGGTNGNPSATGPAGANGPSGAASPGAPTGAQAAQADKQLLDSFSNFGLGPGSQYQHLLVAN